MYEYVVEFFFLVVFVFEVVDFGVECDVFCYLFVGVEV